MQPNVILVGNHKGGVGKTSLTANLGGLYAAAGWEVLLVDLDPQGNLATHLGVDGKGDDGDNLARAVLEGRALSPVRAVRDGLDLVPAGSAWRRAVPHLADLENRPRRARGVDGALGAIAHHYDLVLLDCPPGDEQIQRAGLLAAHYVLLPTTIDPSSLGALASTVAQAVDLKLSGRNPWLEALGVVVFGAPSRSSAVIDQARADLAGLLGDAVPVFDAIVRDVRVSATKAQRAGLLVHEAEKEAGEQRPWWQILREPAAGRPSSATRLDPRALSGLAGDYLALARSVQDEYLARQRQYEEAIRG